MLTRENLYPHLNSAQIKTKQTIVIYEIVSPQATQIFSPVAIFSFKYE
jgi:hypothetical protein